MTDRHISSFEIVLGRTQFGVDATIDLVGDSSHIVVQGKTRSGKSVLTYLLLGQAAQCRAIHVVGSDPTGLLLAPFADSNPGDPKLVLGPENQERTLDMLRAVKGLSDWRIQKMNSLGIDKFDVFSSSFPLVLVVLEEFPGIIDGAADEDAAFGRKPADRVAPRIQALYRQLLAQSAKAGIRVVTLAQRAEASVLGGSARSNIGTRITLRVDEPESIRMLHPNVTEAECDQISRFVPGMAYFDRPGSKRTVIRADFVSDYREYTGVVRSALRGRRGGSVGLDDLASRVRAEKVKEVVRTQGMNIGGHFEIRGEEGGLGGAATYVD